MTAIDIENYSIESDGSTKERRIRNAKQLVEHTRKIFESGKTLPVLFREQQLRNLIAFFTDNHDAICEALKKDLGRHRQESVLLDIECSLNETKRLLFNLREWAKPEKPATKMVNWLDGVYIYNDPYGVVLVIGVWNYPFQLTLIPAAGAIAAGNCVVIKLPELAPASSDLMARLLPQYLDTDCYPIFEGGVPEMTELLQEKFDYMFFTGSTNIGKIIHQAANKHLTPVTLELGGKSPVYIDDSVDFTITAKRIMWGKLSNAGQTCIAPDYVLCTKEVEKEFIRNVEIILKDFYKTSSTKAPSDYSKIISNKHLNRLVSLLKDGKIALGGNFNANDRFFDPTLLVDVDPEAAVMQEEIFGPILPIVNVKDVNGAIDFINSKDKPLALYIFSTRKADVELILSRTSSGGVTVNDTLLHYSVKELGFGGVGGSGMGSYHGRRSFDTFTHKKSVLVKDFNPLLEKVASGRYPPYSDTKTGIMALLLKERKGLPCKYLSYIIVFIMGILVSYFVHKI